MLGLKDLIGRTRRLNFPALNSLALHRQVLLITFCQNHLLGKLVFFLLVLFLDIFLLIFLVILLVFYLVGVAYVYGGSLGMKLLLVNHIRVAAIRHLLR